MAVNNVRMDSHKLIYHIDRVAKWKKGEIIYPIEVEIGLSGACNHRCIFCALDYVGYKTKFMDTEVILKNLEILSKKGLKSVIFSGEGEPLLNKDAPYIIRKTKEFGIDAAMATNAVLFTKEKAEECLSSLTWIRFSVAAITNETYKKIHRAKEGDLQKVLTNLSDAVEIKRRDKLKTTLGVQMLLLPENQDEVELMAKTVKEIGIDYLAVKPFSQHPSSLVKRQVDYSESAEIEKSIRKYEDEEFKIYFRRQAIENISHEKTYDKCYALPFMTHINAEGKIFPCVAFVDNESLCYGNIYENTFDEIWESDHTKKIMETFQGEFLKKYCRKACRLDEMNKYLNELKNPGAHVNFI